MFWITGTSRSSSACNFANNLPCVGVLDQTDYLSLPHLLTLWTTLLIPSLRGIVCVCLVHHCQVAITVYWLGRKANRIKTFEGPKLNLTEFSDIVPVGILYYSCIKPFIFVRLSKQFYFCVCWYVCMRLHKYVVLSCAQCALNRILFLIGRMINAFCAFINHFD